MPTPTQAKLPDDGMRSPGDVSPGAIYPSNMAAATSGSAGAVAAQSERVIR